MNIEKEVLGLIIQIRYTVKVYWIHLYIQMWLGWDQGVKKEEAADTEMIECGRGHSPGE